MRDQVAQLVRNLTPLDSKEEQAKARVLGWIGSGAELCRRVSPATPAPHLVSYFALVDGPHILLGDHRKSGLLLPCGGHVDPGEHPTDTVHREAAEELSIKAELVIADPVFLTMTPTVGADSHEDVSLWYVVKGDRSNSYDFDRGEYFGLSWFPFDKLPEPALTDPELQRFCAKLSSVLEDA